MRVPRQNLHKCFLQNTFFPQHFLPKSNSIYFKGYASILPIVVFYNFYLKKKIVKCLDLRILKRFSLELSLKNR